VSSTNCTQQRLVPGLIAHSLTKRLLKLETEGYCQHAVRQIDRITRRVLKGEVIPHQEKVCFIFEPHTDWISKGKAGVPVEPGLKE